MKRSMLISALALTCLGAADPSPASMVNPSYLHGTYDFSGTVATKHGEHESLTTFTGKTTATTLTIQWEQITKNSASTLSSAFTMKGTLAVGPTGGDVNSAGIIDQHHDDPNMAVAAATGISSGCAHVMYSLWSGKAEEILPSIDVKIVTDGPETTITGNRSLESSVTAVLTAGRLVSLTVKMDPSRTSAEVDIKLSDEDIDKILASTKQPVSEEARARIRKMLKDAEGQMKSDKTPISWLTTITVTEKKD